MVSFNLDENQVQKLHLVCAVRDVSVDEYVQEIIKTHLDNLSAEEIITKVKAVFGETEPPKPVVKRSMSKDSDTFKVAKVHQRPYIGLTLRRCNFVSKGKRKDQILTLDVNDALYIQQLGILTFGEYKSLCKELDVSKQVLARFIFNLQTGEFDELIDDFKNKMTEVKFTEKDGTIFFNDEKAFGVPYASILMHQFHNSMKSKEETIWNLIKTNPQHDELHIRILCENANNPELTKFLEQKKTVPVINNREKRQELITNNGGI